MGRCFFFSAAVGRSSEFVVDPCRMMILAVLVLTSMRLLSTCVFFDKVVDVPVVRSFSSSTVMTSPWSCAASDQLLSWRIDSALGSEFKSCPPVAAHPS